MDGLPEGPLQRPRILVTEADIDRTRRAIKESEHHRDWFKSLRTQGEALCTTPPSEYSIPDGIRLLETSRTVLDRVLTLGALWQLTEEDRFADRAWKELSTAADFPDWNPSHFLDTAEMTMAFAVGIDWFASYWDEEQLSELTTAVVKQGLQPALPGYRGETEQRGHRGRPLTWWRSVSHNWNTVCNGGLACGALALCGTEIDEDLLETVFSGAHRSIQRPLASLAPRGGWPEGPGYFSYNVRYLAYYLSSVLNVCPDAQGYLDLPGMDRIGDFPLQLTGPTDRVFNYGDVGSPGRNDDPALFWFARAFDRPRWALYQRESADDDVHPLNLLWSDPSDWSEASRKSLPRDAVFPGAENTVTMRESWDDPAASYAALKGGSNQVNHGDLDLGQFVFDRDGYRWAVDLGADDYLLDGYWDTGIDGGRWQYYRKRAEGHNTLLIDPDSAPDQHPFAVAPLDRTVTDSDQALAIVDLSAAYGIEHAHRGIGLVNGRRDLLVTDELRSSEPVTVHWRFHTPATIRLDGSRATLRFDESTLPVRILHPSDASFSVREAEPLPSSPRSSEQGSNDAIQVLEIRLNDVKSERVSVLFGSKSGGSAYDVPLEEWVKSGLANE